MSWLAVNPVGLKMENIEWGSDKPREIDGALLLGESKNSYFRAYTRNFQVINERVEEFLAAPVNLSQSSTFPSRFIWAVDLEGASKYS